MNFRDQNGNPMLLSSLSRQYLIRQKFYSYKPEFFTLSFFKKCRIYIAIYSAKSTSIIATRYLMHNAIRKALYFYSELQILWFKFEY